MRCIKVKPLNDYARSQVASYGDVWEVLDERSYCDRQYFKTSKPQLYIAPFNPTTPRRLGAKWIDINNDPNFDYDDVPTPRIKRAA